MKDSVTINRRIVRLHDLLKVLALIASHDFPSEPAGIALVENIVVLQTALAAYLRELLVRLFQLDDSRHWHSSRFLDLWRDRGKLEDTFNQTEGEIDASIRGTIAELSGEMEMKSEEDLRSSVETDELPDMLYYLSTLQESLSWYLGRYLERPCALL